MYKLPQICKDFIELFYPSCCITCGNRLISQEKYLCMKCWADLPVSRFHLDPENKTAQIFWGRVAIENAASWYLYRKGSRYQKIIYAIKYKGMKELGRETGLRYGEELATSPRFQTVDLVVPVPLHPKKERKRGFNQSAWIARGIAASLQIPVSENILIRSIHTPTQTRKNRYERWMNMEGIFRVTEKRSLDNRHILLIDDVVTTGATLEACAIELLKIPGVRLSIATLAYADL